MATGQYENFDDGAFSAVCGQNITVRGNTAEWCNVYSGGRIFVDGALSPNSEIILRLTESGHADVGILTKNPRSLSDLKNIANMHELRVIQAARIHKQEGVIKIKRSQNGQKIITNQADQTHNFSVQDAQEVWITVNIIFGTLKVRIDSPNYEILLLPCDENICISTNKKEANLKYANPSAICFFKHPVERGESICFSIEPLVTDGRSSRNFAVNFALSEVNPETFLNRRNMFDMSLLPVLTFEQPSTKVKNEITFKLNSEGIAEIRCEKGVFTKNVSEIKKAYFLLQICRVTIKYLYKTQDMPATEQAPEGQEVTSLNGANVADSIYVNSKRQLDGIQYEVENLPSQRENENEGTNVHQLEKLQRQISDISKRLQSLQEQIITSNRNDTLSENTEYLAQQMQEIKAMLREKTKSDGFGQLKEITLNDLIQSNYADLVKLLDPIPVSDRLLQHKHITWEEHERNRSQYQTDRCETNRNILDVIIKRSIEVDVFIQILKDTKQDGVLAKICQQKNTN